MRLLQGSSHILRPDLAEAIWVLGTAIARGDSHLPRVCPPAAQANMLMAPITPDVDTGEQEIHADNLGGLLVLLAEHAVVHSVDMNSRELT